MTERRVVMIGSFPPPVGGAAMVNALVRDALLASGVDVIPLDVAGPRLAHNRGLGYHLQRVRRNLSALARARVVGGRGAALYIVPDAGVGAWYTAAHVQLAAHVYDALFVHHHSCRYIEEYSRPIARIVAARPDATMHIFLTEGMATAFQQRYGAVRYRIATNARFVAREAAAPLSTHATPSIHLGHLSNLCADKGFFAVADAFDQMRDAGLDVTLTLAGPSLDDTVSVRLAALAARHGDRFAYLGALKGEAKRDFYRSLDAFLFPTRFRQEAAPLVIYEALAAGVPVLATDRGMIAEIVPPLGGGICSRDADFAAFLHTWLTTTPRSDPMAIKAWIRDECDRSARQYEKMFALLANRAIEVPIGDS